MEAPSAHGHRGRVPWTGLLLAVSLLFFWIPPTNGGFTVESCQYPFIKYTDANMCAYNIPRDAVRISWYKGDFQNVSNLLVSYIFARNELIPGPASTGRHRINRDGSLKILRVSKVDSGYYIVRAERPNNQTSTASLYYFAQEPVNQHSVQVSPSTVLVNSTVFIACVTKATGCSVSWYFNDRRLRLNNRMKLARDQETLVIKQVKMEDAGQYHCKFVRRLLSGKSEHLRLEVVNRNPS